MKILKKETVVKRKQVAHTQTERRVLSSIDHPFIVKLHYAFQTDTKLYLVLDYAAGGELFFHLSRMRRFPEVMTRFYAAEIVLALKALHKIGVAYRDLKPENILLDSEGHVKLADFGLAKENMDDPVQGAYSVCGTPEYLSPEVINKHGHGTAVDWWNLGMVVYELLTGLPPWYTEDRSELFHNIRNAPLCFPRYVSREAASFIEGLLSKNPLHRLGAKSDEHIQDHGFFQSINWVDLYNKRIRPPFDPCRHDSGDGIDTVNFDPEFTNMNVHDDWTDPKSKNMASEPFSDDLFSNFTYQEDSDMFAQPRKVSATKY